MPKAIPEVPVEPRAPEQANLGCLVRLAWMFLGNGLLALSAGVIAGHRSSVFSVADLVFWADVGMLVGLRYLDITRLQGLTAAGTPATRRHWRRYVMALLIVAATAWALAHLISWLRR